MAIIIFLIFTSTFISLVNLQQRTIFGWDQARDAQVLLDIIKNHHFTLIGPRATSPDSFFLGPLWYYLLLPFYFFTHLDPIATSFFFAFTSSTTTLSFYLVGKSLFNRPIGLIAALLYLPTGQIITWNPMLIPLATIVYISCLYKIIQGKSIYIPLSFLLFGIGLQLHFQAVFFVIPLIIALLLYKHTHPWPTKKIILAILLFLLTFTPLIIFDLRHSFLQAKSFLTFILSSQAQSNLTAQLISSILKFLNELSSKVFPTFPPQPLLGSITLLLATLGIITSERKVAAKWLLLSFLLLPPFFFSLYSNTLSEYYFLLCLPSLILGISLMLIKIAHINYLGKLVFVLIISFTTITKIEVFNASFSDTSLYHHKQAVNFISNQTLDDRFNVSYSVPQDGDTPFRYLFSLQKRQPENSPYGHLWTIVIPSNSENIPPIATFGNIGVIRR